MTSQNQVDTDKMRRAYQQLFNGSQTLLEIKSTSWIDKVLLKRIHDQYGRKLEQVGDPLPLDTGVVGGDRISFGSFSGGTVAIGQGAIAVGSQGNDQRNEQYEIAKNWDGERLMRGFDLSERDLSGLNLVNADLRKANLKGADLSKTNLMMSNLSEVDLRDANLKEADLSEADLSGAKYSDDTIWPDNFNPSEVGAILVSGEGESVEDLGN